MTPVRARGAVPSALTATPTTKQRAAAAACVLTAAASDDCAPLCPHCHNVLCTPPARPARIPSASLDSVPDDALEIVAVNIGSDLGRFAAVSKRLQGVCKPSVWRQAYEGKEEDDVDSFGADALPESLWRECLLRGRGANKRL